MTSMVHNETMLKRVQMGTETAIGTLAAPTFKLYGDMQLNKGRNLIQKGQRTGSFDTYKDPKFGMFTFDGTYADDLSFEDWSILMRYGVSDPPTPTDDGNTVHGYTWDYKPDAGKIDSFSAEEGFDGIPFQVKGGQFGDFTVSHDIEDQDGNWKFSANVVMSNYDTIALQVTATAATGGTTTTVVKTGAAWVVNAYQGLFVRMLTGTAGNIGEIREIASNDATTLTLVSALPSAVTAADTFEISGKFTGSLTDRTLDYIQNEGTQMFLADNLAGLSTATNEVKDKLISFSLTQNNTLKLKKFSDNLGSYSKKRGRGERFISGSVVMEFDDWTEYKKFEAASPVTRALQFQQLNGPTINVSPATTHTAKIILPKVYWNTINKNQDRNGNVTAAFEFWCYLDSTAGYVVNWQVKNKLSVLP